MNGRRRSTEQLIKGAKLVRYGPVPRCDMEGCNSKSFMVGQPGEMPLCMDHTFAEKPDHIGWFKNLPHKEHMTVDGTHQVSIDEMMAPVAILGIGVGVGVFLRIGGLEWSVVLGLIILGLIIKRWW